MNTMTPSAQGMTDGQIDKAADMLRAKLRKHRNEMATDPVQQVLGQSELMDDMFSVFRHRVEAVSSMIVRRVKVDRSRTPQEVLDATGRKQYTDDKVVQDMPRGEGEEKKISFFKPKPEEYDHDGWMSDEALERALALRGLHAVDPYSLAKANEDDPAFADTHPNGTHWKDADGKWCFARFYRWRDERRVDVDRVRGWFGRWWFAGVCE